MSQDPLLPTTLEAVQDAVIAAAESGEALEVLGRGGKRFYGRPVQAARTLDVSGLAGVVDYQPHELILVARPGTLMKEVEATLAEAGQAFAFEPPHLSDNATLGGTLACNLSGPRRFKAGAARDHLLGFQAVTGRGEVVRGGGRVVKNVTGYDLSKLMCGSLGTLAVLTEVVVKVLPRPESERTVALRGLSDTEGMARLTAASRSSHEPSGLAHLPSGAALEGTAAALAGGESLTVIRVEGPAPSVQARSEAIAREAGGAADFLEAGDSRGLWTAVRELAPIPVGKDEVLWRLSAPPTAGAGLGEALRGLGARRLAYDWGGALVWAVLGAPSDPARIHVLAREAGGHAQRFRAGGAAAGDGAVFSELTPGQHRLNLNLKLAFDPSRILNPGRMYPDI